MFNIAIGSVMHESNSFSPIKTELKDFRDDQFLMDKAVFDYHRGKSTEIGGMLEVLGKNGQNPHPTLSAIAIPSGPVTEEAFAAISGKLLEKLEKIQSPDGILLALHGGMGTESIPDAEAFLLRRIRESAGPKTLIGVTLDHHANISKDMLENSDFIIGYRTHPHVDQKDVGAKAAEIMLSFLEKKIRPVMKMAKLPLLLPGESSPVPREKLLKKLEEIEKIKGVVSASFFIGFPFADINDVGACAVAVTDGNEKLAEDSADTLAALIWEQREKFTLPVVSLDEAIARAEKAGNGPAVFVDMGDCSYAGAAGDVTYFARALLEKGVKNAVVAAIIDSEAVDKCIKAGPGAEITLSIGGKLDTVNSKPLEVKGTVRLISDGRYSGRDFYLVKTEVDIGTAAVFNVRGIDIILVTRRMTTYDPALLCSLGIEPEEKKIVVLKGGMLNSITYRDIAKEIIPFKSPGFACWNFPELRYKRIPRPIYPIDKNTTWKESEA
jgi:microcystin degradation protein MlrC